MMVFPLGIGQWSILSNGWHSQLCPLPIGASSILLPQKGSKKFTACFPMRNYAFHCYQGLWPLWPSFFVSSSNGKKVFHRVDHGNYLLASYQPTLEADSLLFASTRKACSRCVNTCKNCTIVNLEWLARLFAKATP